MAYRFAKTTKPITSILVLVAALGVASLASPAAAQPQPCKLTEPPTPPDPTAPPRKDAPYESPMRQQCEDELDKDDAWWFNLEGRLRNHIHEQTSKEVTTNNRHVVIAYAAMWLLAIGFVVILWRKQQAMRAEIERLEHELKKAEK